MARILRGIEISAQIRGDLRLRVEALRRLGVTPGSALGEALRAKGYRAGRRAA